MYQNSYPPLMPRYYYPPPPPQYYPRPPPPPPQYYPRPPPPQYYPPPPNYREVDRLRSYPKNSDYDYRDSRDRRESGTSTGKKLLYGGLALGALVGASKINDIAKSTSVGDIARAVGGVSVKKGISLKVNNNTFGLHYNH